MSFYENMPGGANELDTSNSELSAEERARIDAYTPDATLRKQARKIVGDASWELGFSSPAVMVVQEAAKILGALGEKRIPRDMNDRPDGRWLLVEAYIRLKMDLAPLLEAATSRAFAGGESTPEKREADLGPLNGVIDELLTSETVRLSGYSTTPPQYCRFVMKNEKSAQLFVNENPGPGGEPFTLVLKNESDTTMSTTQVKGEDAVPLIRFWSTTARS